MPVRTALVPQVLPDRLDMVLLVRNLVFAVLSLLVALRVHPVTVLLDEMVQQVPMVVVGLAVLSVMKLPVRAVSVLLEQMALVLPVRTV